MRHWPKEKKKKNSITERGDMSEVRDSYGKFHVTFIGYLLNISFRSLNTLNVLTHLILKIAL